MRTSGTFLDFHQRSTGIGDLLLVPGGFFGGVLSTELGIYATWAAGDGWSAENLGSLICQYDYHASLIDILDVLDTVIVSGDNVYSQSGAEERTRGIFTQEWFDTSDNIHIGSLTVFRIIMLLVQYGRMYLLVALTFSIHQESLEFFIQKTMEIMHHTPPRFVVLCLTTRLS